MPLSPGARLGPYDLQSRVGGGGRGEVWKAYDAKLQRTVAIKVLHDTADTASRILAETRAASALNHPHICTIHDVGDAAPSTPSTRSGQADSGQAVSFIVMEYVEGIDVAADGRFLMWRADRRDRLTLILNWPEAVERIETSGAGK